MDSNRLGRIFAYALRHKPGEAGISLSTIIRSEGITRQQRDDIHRSSNGVWLTDAVPSQFVTVVERPIAVRKTEDTLTLD